MKSLISLLGLAFLAFGGFASAVPLHLGNLAPLPSNDHTVTFQIGDIKRDLQYRGFTPVDLPKGAHAVQVIRKSDGVELATATINFDPLENVTPALLLIGNGSTQPFRVVLEWSPVEMWHPSAEKSVPFILHHFSQPAAAQAETPAFMEAECTWATSSAQGRLQIGGGHSYRFGDRIAPSVGTGQQYDRCEFKWAANLIGSFEFQLEPSVNVATRRVYLIGDGEEWPAEVLVMDGSSEVARFLPRTPQPGALSKSRDHWYDVSRPMEGLYLKEMAGGGFVVGTWFTTDTEGRPTWYLFEGAKGAAPGHRDVALFHGSRASGAQELAAVAIGRLIYTDCNNVELRVSFASEPFKSARFRRNAHAAFCGALH